MCYIYIQGRHSAAVKPSETRSSVLCGPGIKHFRSYLETGTMWETPQTGSKRETSLGPGPTILRNTPNFAGGANLRKGFKNWLRSPSLTILNGGSPAWTASTAITCLRTS